MGINFITSIFLGIIEGLTEFAPVSSTAHILIGGKILGITSSSFFDVFTIAIQSGAILATVTFFWKKVWSNMSLIPKVIVGFIPTAIAGILLHSLISKIFASTWIIGLMLIIGGIVFIFIKPIDTITDISDISYKKAFIIGCTQIIAFIPGVSRSGATLIGGTFLKIPRSQIVSFSFLLGIPTILGASIIGLKDIPQISFLQWQLIITGCVVSFIVASITIKWFLNVLTEKPLSWFGWYRIIVGVIVLFFIS